MGTNPMIPKYAFNVAAHAQRRDACVRAALDAIDGREAVEADARRRGRRAMCAKARRALVDDAGPRSQPEA